MHSEPHTPRLILVDGSGYIFRAFHALPPLTRRDGTPVGAVYGFTTMLLKLRETYKNDMLVVIFDAGRATFRSEIYPEYKMNRSETPEDLIPQFPLVREATRALSIPAIELANYEADDLIASYAEAARAQGREVVIVSSDKDLMQLVVDGAVTMMDPMKQKFIGSAQVIEKFGVGPEKVVEVQALIGDPTDNVPGVPSIGPKTAAELITQFGTLEGVLANLAAIKQPKRREVLETHAEAARMSRQLVELKRDIPLPEPLTALVTRPLDSAALGAFLEAQNFTTLAKKMKVGGGEGTRHPGPHPDVQPHHISAKTRLPLGSVPGDVVGANPTSPDGRGAQAALPPHITTNYACITDESTLLRWIDTAKKTGLLAVDTETTSLAAVDAELVGISLSTGPGEACYIPLAHVGAAPAGASQGSLFGTEPEAAPTPARGALLGGQLDRTRVLALLAPLFTDPSVLKIGHNIKYDLVVLEKYGAEITPVADTMLMSYCVSGGLHAQGLDFLAERHFGHKMIAFEEVTGSGKNKITFAQVSLEAATAYAAEDADFTLRLYHTLLPQLIASHVVGVYETIERPLVPVIARMEAAGIAVDVGVLRGLSGEFMKKIAALEEEIIALAGMPFSVGSPKQLGEVLYDKLQLGGAKKSSKTGAYTTDAATLEALAEEGHAIAAKVLEWRQYSKLKSTYTDALPRAISPRDGRVHTSFSMATTTTGRLSSSDPNLQNIPIRTEEGRRIRTAFIAPPGYQLLSADYSQIELRLLAHMAEIPVLRDAFRGGADIHAVTASEMFGVPLNQMTPELRRRAKSINFGIIYGISAHGLAAQLGISRSEAGSYIEKYFEKYPGIREYMDRTIAFARAHGYVETLYGRRIHVRDINSKNPNFRSFSERAAINAPLQGTAADIIKRAMVAVDGGLKMPARLLLQVHDELIIEAPADQATALAAQVKQAMEQVAALSVPLTVEVGIGSNWGSAH